MIKEFVGFIIEGKSQKRSSFAIDTDKKILACQKVGVFSSLFGGAGAIGALLHSGIDALKKNNITIYNISNIISVDYFRFGITSKAILLKTNTEEIKFLSESPKDTMELLQNIIEEKK